MENTYLGILRGKMLPMEISAQMLLKGAEDKIFYLETKQISGYTTKLTLRNAINTAKEQNAQDEQLALLMEELNQMKLDQNHERAASDQDQGQSLLNWIGI
ncbi:MAG: hypothetical protein K0Q99_333 [Clostridia bacterium]|jgi:hypothetical protein|nr:hypothetical protein [Clostridia bacterium]